MKMDEKIKNAFQNWEEKPNEISFDKEKVWNDINDKKPPNYKFYYLFAIAAIFLIMVGSGFYLMDANRQLREQYQASIYKLEVLKNKESNRIISKNADTIYKIKIKEVYKESPQLKYKVKTLQTKLESIREEKSQLYKKLISAVTYAEEIQKDVYSIKTDSALASLPVKNNVKEFKKETKSKEIKIQINLQALAQLPYNRKEKETEEEPKLKLKIIKETKEFTESSAPLFSSIRIK